MVIISNLESALIKHGTNSIPTAVVGAGRMGQVHARIVAESPRADLVAIVEPNETLGRKVADSYFWEIRFGRKQYGQLFLTCVNAFMQLYVHR
ncbi:MAG: Gfo/Idh/MocA family oxidoreductase [Candidatus Nanopelagicaceae bacterium]